MRRTHASRRLAGGVTGVPSILGACVREPGRTAEFEGRGARATLLATDRASYGRLCRILSWRHLVPDEFSLETALLRWGEGLVVLSDDEALLRALAPELPDGSLFVELRVSPSPKPLSLSRELSLPVVATGCVHFLRPRDRNLARVLTAIDRNLTFRDVPEAAVAPAAAAFATRAQMGERFAGAARRYRPITPAVIRRLEEELSVILDLGFPEYFLIVNDIARFARERGIPIAGRGSAADSIVAYCLGISIVDPIQWDLYFERFLNRSRTDPPDIDIDICWRGRDDVLDYVYETYGRDRVAMIATLNTFQGRSSFREVAKTFGLSDSEVTRFSRRLPHHYPGPLAEAVQKLPECRDLPAGEEPWRTILRIADRIEGYPRHLSLHPCGIVIAPTEIVDHVPVERSAKGLVVTQFDKDPIAEIGLVKIDLLGQRSLAAIADTVRAVERLHGETIDLSRSSAASRTGTSSRMRP